VPSHSQGRFSGCSGCLPGASDAVGERNIGQADSLAQASKASRKARRKNSVNRQRFVSFATGTLKLRLQLVRRARLGDDVEVAEAGEHVAVLGFLAVQLDLE